MKSYLFDICIFYSVNSTNKNPLSKYNFFMIVTHKIIKVEISILLIEISILYWEIWRFFSLFFFTVFYFCQVEKVNDVLGLDSLEFDVKKSFGVQESEFELCHDPVDFFLDRNKSSQVIVWVHFVVVELLAFL